MTVKLDYEWKLREIMATRGMFSTTDIRPRLIERGVVLSPSQIWRLVTEKPERLNLKVLIALIDILDCHMDELIKPIAAAATGRKKTAGGAASSPSEREAGVGAFRPKRARITDR